MHNSFICLFVERTKNNSFGQHNNMYRFLNFWSTKWLLARSTSKERKNMKLAGWLAIASSLISCEWKRERKKEHTAAVWQVAIFAPFFRFVNSTILMVMAFGSMLTLVGLITQFEVLDWEENVLPHSVEAEHEILERWLLLRATNKWRDQQLERKIAVA